MIIDGDGHFFETEEMFEKHMEPALQNYRPRLLTDDQGRIATQRVHPSPRSLDVLTPRQAILLSPRSHGVRQERDA